MFRNETTQPLLQDDRTVFRLDDDEDDDGNESSALEPDRRGVRFEERVQVIAPSLRSMTSSRETEFDQDPDEIDESQGLELETRIPRGYREQQMPLLVGLFDSSASRDVSVPLLPVNGAEPHLTTSINLEDIAAKRVAGGGLLDSIANMANSILGAGACYCFRGKTWDAKNTRNHWCGLVDCPSAELNCLSGLPYAVRQAGFITGLVLLFVLCAATDWTIRLIVINAKLSGTHSYIDIMTHCWGSSGRAAVSFFQFAFAFGGMCAFGIIIGDTIPGVIASAFPKLYEIPVLYLLTDRKFVIALCTICVSYPLSLYRDIHKLSRASGLALVGMLIIVTSVMIESPQTSPDLKGDPSKRFSFIEPGIFQAIGVISFAFVCHHNSLLIYGSLRTPTLDRFAFVTHISTLLSLVACTTLAVSGYVVFTDKTQGNILNNFARSDTLINVARFCFGLNMFTTLPLELFVIEQYFFSHETFKLERHVFFTTTILFASMLISLITCDLGVMLEITGGVAASALAFIFPASCFIKLSDRDAPWHSRAKLPAYICATFGVVVMIISLFLALQKSWSPEGSAKICI
ncbi:Aa-trans domain-containing protein [Mycena kentingensis (nom. inval.)]|nr:Aa-trans domain-containing protein [Mycena kentingensis (nom. inval.)]